VGTRLNPLDHPFHQRIGQLARRWHLQFTLMPQRWNDPTGHRIAGNDSRPRVTALEPPLRVVQSQASLHLASLSVALVAVSYQQGTHMRFEQSLASRRIGRARLFGVRQANGHHAKPEGQQRADPAWQAAAVNASA
jgi:hypothetical protein